MHLLYLGEYGLEFFVRHGEVNKGLLMVAILANKQPMK